MVCVYNIDYFIKESCHIICQDNTEASLFREDSAGTVNATLFIQFIEEMLVGTKVLDSYTKGEQKSIFVLYNASIHNDLEV